MSQEHSLNSRTLTSISNTLLTSKHTHIMLLGLSQLSFQPRNFENVKVKYHKKWKATQAYTNLFWNRWLFEYLPTLLPKTKWANKKQNFAVGDLLIVRNKSTPKSHWLRVWIVLISHGDSRIDRTVKIWMLSGEFIRSVSLLLLDNSKQ